MFTEAEALAQDSPRRHVLLRFDLGEVQRTGEDENVRQVDEALEEGDGGLHRQTLGRLDVLQLMLVGHGGTQQQEREQEKGNNRKKIQVLMIILMCKKH